MSHEPPYTSALLLSMVVQPELHKDPRSHHRHHHARRARPPGRVRRAAASVLVRAAARLAKEPVHALPRRA